MIGTPFSVRLLLLESRGGDRQGPGADPAGTLPLGRLPDAVKLQALGAALERERREGRFRTDADFAVLLREALRERGLDVAVQTRQVSSLRESFSVVTSPAVQVCNLRAATPDQSDARGMLFVAADHQHWTMSLRGLRPPAGGKVYQLWFVADQGMVSGGTFAARPGAPVELGSDRMPAGTRGVKITLENVPGAPAPSGSDVLRNADTLHTL